MNILRSRKGVLHGDSKSAQGLDMAHKAANVVRFSGRRRRATQCRELEVSWRWAVILIRTLLCSPAVCDVGAASFKYDMRRLSEILALPKAWYRRSLARRMFLGEETAVIDSDTGKVLDARNSKPSNQQPIILTLCRSYCMSA